MWTATDPGTYGGVSRTSAATPLLAWAAAVILAASPMNPATMKALLVNEAQPLADGMLPEVGLDVKASLQASLSLVVYDNGASTHTEGSAVGHLIAADYTETLPWLPPDFEILLSTSISVKRFRLRQVSGTGLRYTCSRTSAESACFGTIRDRR
jgi:hypothetical protein